MIKEYLKYQIKNLNSHHKGQNTLLKKKVKLMKIVSFFTIYNNKKESKDTKDIKRELNHFLYAEYKVNN